MSRQPGPPPLRRAWRAAWALVLAGIALYGALTTAYVLARLMVGERWDVVAFANNFLPWWALGGLVLGGIALLSRWRLGLVALQAPVLVAFVALYGGRYLPRALPDPPPGGVELRVATFNVLGAVSDPAQVTAAIAGLDADIVGLQELGAAHVAQIEADLAAQYPHRQLFPSPYQHGVGLLSRYPIRDQHEYYLFVKNYVRHVRLTLDVEGRPVIVYLTHAHPPRSYLPFRYDVALRGEQIDALTASIRAETGPVLVLCDCNMSDQSDDYRQLDRLLNDAYREAGRGLGLTFPAGAGRRFGLLPRVLRLDYVWYSDHFVIQAAHVAADAGSSDHRPVSARLVLKPTGRTP